VKLKVTIETDMYPDHWSISDIVKEEQKIYQKYPGFLWDWFEEDNFTVKVTKEKTCKH